MLNLMITNTANYRFMLNDVHSFNFMVGQEGVDYHYEGFQVTTRGQTNDILTNLSSGSTNFIASCRALAPQLASMTWSISYIYCDKRGKTVF